MKIRLPDFKTANVLVVGDVMLDRYWYGNTSRISPEAPVPVVHIGDIEERAGGAGNVALNITSLGGAATVLALTGDDHRAEVLQSLLQDAGVTCEFEKLEDSTTVTKLRVISRHQQLLRMDFEDGFGTAAAGKLGQRFEKLLAPAGAVVFSDYGKGSLASVQQLIQAARAQQKPIIVDPKGTDFSRYRGATLITPNMTEFEIVAGRCSSEEDLQARAEQLRRDLELSALLITRSDKGMTLIRGGQEALTIPTRAKEVFDVTGAGDTVVAVIAAVLASGQDLVTAMALSNLAAGVVVGKLGTATANILELRQALDAHTPARKGVLTEAEAISLVAAAKESGETVVMTNGCFDLLHEGHITYLQQARDRGDRLLVAVNSDDSVKKLKGENRPVNSLSSRMAVLAALKSVDWVVPFTEETPERLICALLPNVLVKGGDYQVHEVAGGECVQKAGGSVEIQGLVESFSTSSTIERIMTASTDSTKR
jgi:D-beta-D-heptose 7-phosphate kinase/D-beta-D-heptose 1-phosphate adenosyltransferase